jgi:hypothetical protein
VTAVVITNFIHQLKTETDQLKWDSLQKVLTEEKVQEQVTFEEHKGAPMVRSDL